MKSLPIAVAIVASSMILSGTAFAASLITSKQIKDKTIAWRDLSPAVTKAIYYGYDRVGVKLVAGSKGYTSSLTGRATSTATCPEGTVLTGGGAETDGSMALSDQHASGNTWSVEAIDLTDATLAGVKAIAYCGYIY